MTRPLVLITGASSGIGAAFARYYAAKGWDLALVARREDRLIALAKDMQSQHGTTCLVIPANLADPDAPEGIYSAVLESARQVDALVNNAGYGLPGPFMDSNWDTHAGFMQLMVTSYTHLAHLVLPEMIKRQYGRILNVASVAGLMPGGNGHTCYGASKSFLIKFSQSLHAELEDKGVHVTALCPGFTYSEFHDVNKTRDIVSRLPKHWWLTADRVAKAGYEAVERNKVIAVPGTWYKFLVGLNKVLPDGVGMALMKRGGASVGAKK